MNMPQAASSPLATALAGAGLSIVGPCHDLAERDVGLLRGSALLQDFLPSEISTLGQAMLLVRANAGQRLITEGEMGDWMLLLLSGTVDVTKRSGSGEPSRLAVIRAGAAVGEMSMLDGELRYASCTAIEPVEAGVLGREAVAGLIRDHPAVGAKLLVKITQLLAQRLRNTSNQLVRALQAR